MAVIFGYGEDAITHWALTHELGRVMNQLGDASETDDCYIFYRPSFGRGGKSKSLFGEFDAIMVTPLCTYLIESKWSGSRELITGDLSHGQKLRHRVVEWIARNWDGARPFEEFVLEKRRDFTIEFAGKELPSPGSGVFKRMEFILKKAHEISGRPDIRIRNVVLVLLETDPGDKKYAFKGFDVVKICYHPIDNSNFFYMDRVDKMN